MLALSNETNSKIAALCVAYGVKELTLFGSALTDRFREDSDIDLLVDFLPGRSRTYFDLFHLRNDLALVLGREVDLVPRGGLRPILAEEVLRNTSLIYASR